MYALAHEQSALLALRTHVVLSVAALALASAITIPLGMWTARSPAGPPVIAATNAASVVPSLAVLTLMLPILGLGFAPALVALTLLACPPVLINTDLGYRSVHPSILEAAAGMGMRPGQILRRVQTPLAASIVVAGVRTAAVNVIASATLAAFIGGGGLGDFIVDGLANNDTSELLLGASLVALLALIAEGVLGLFERALSVARP